MSILDRIKRQEVSNRSHQIGVKGHQIRSVSVEEGNEPSITAAQEAFPLLGVIFHFHSRFKLYPSVYCCLLLGQVMSPHKSFQGPQTVPLTNEVHSLVIFERVENAFYRFKFPSQMATRLVMRSRCGSKYGTHLCWLP